MALIIDLLINYDNFVMIGAKWWHLLGTVPSYEHVHILFTNV